MSFINKNTFEIIEQQQVGSFRWPSWCWSNCSCQLLFY